MVRSRSKGPKILSSALATGLAFLGSAAAGCHAPPLNSVARTRLEAAETAKAAEVAGHLEELRRLEIEARAAARRRDEAAAARALAVARQREQAAALSAVLDRLSAMEEDLEAARARQRAIDAEFAALAEREAELQATRERVEAIAGEVAAQQAERQRLEAELTGTRAELERRLATLREAAATATAALRALAPLFPDPPPDGGNEGVDGAAKDGGK